MDNERLSVRLYADVTRGARRSIDLIAPADGGISLSGADIGERVADLKGDSDWEFWVNIPASAVQRLAFELLKERFTGRAEAWTELKQFCSDHGIAHRSGEWA